MTIKDQIALIGKALSKPRSWCQNQYELPDGRCCILGHIFKLTDFHPSNNPALVKHIEKHIGEPISVFNDKPGQTKANIIKTLREIWRSS